MKEEPDRRTECVGLSRAMPREQSLWLDNLHFRDDGICGPTYISSLCVAWAKEVMETR